MFPFLLIGCAKELEPLNETPGNETNEVSKFDPNKPAVFGEHLDIPYSLENMRAAFDKISPATRGSLSAEDVIVNTHNYIKFTFKTDEQYDFIRNSGIELYFIPMDLDVIQGGYYEDEGNPDGTRVRYCVVSNEQMSIVDECKAEYEILLRLFMPDEDETDTRIVTTRNGSQLSSEFIQELVKQSYILTGNESWLTNENDKPQRPITRARPYGQIQYRDRMPNGSYKTVGMAGLKVKAIRLLKTSTGICDIDGFYSCDKTFSNKWKYETTFERADFDIKNGKSGSFAYVMEKTTSPWSFTIWDESTKGYYMSTIFRATHHYYYMYAENLRQPPMNSTWKTQLKIAALFEDDPDVNGDTKMSRRFLGMGNAIHIYNPNRAPYEIYGTVLHELAHASHWNIAKSDYNINSDTNNRVVESWAVGVSNTLIKRVYPTYRGAVYSHNLYTQVVVDMLDTESDHNAGLNWGLNIAEGDNVHGYTIRQIEDCLPGATSFDRWRNNIYNTYPNNSTRGNLKTLFDAHYR